MPPEIESIPVPTGRGKDALDWLELHGIVPRVPPLRSGSYAGSVCDPFGYFLTERCGLVPAIEDTEALVHGTWMHKALEVSCHLDSVWRAKQFGAAVQARERELRTYCAALGLTPDKTSNIIQIETNRARHAWTWMEAAIGLSVRSHRQPDGGPLAFGAQNWLLREQHQILGHEVMCVYRHPRYPNTVLCMRADILLLHKAQNTLWCIDLKSTGHSPIERAQTCPYEDQTVHYQMVLDALLTEGVLQAKWPEFIDSNTKMGGMRHLIVRKPGIRISGQDRPYTLDTSPLKGGPRKGQPRNEKVFHDEPSFDLYMQRVVDWMTGKGDYTHEAPERLADPVVNLSTSKFSILDDWMKEEYIDKLDVAYKYATCPPLPKNFPRTSAGMIERDGSLSPYAPIYTSPVKDWPEIFRQKLLIQSFRDPTITSTTETGVY